MFLKRYLNLRFAWEAGIYCLLFAALYGIIVALLPGCAACQSCRADEVRPSPQAPSKAWRPVPRNEFATPPTDGPEEPTPTPPPPVAPDPSVPEVTPGEPMDPPTVPGTAKTTTSRETSGGLIIEQHSSGTIIVNSPGVNPPVQASPQAPVAYPLIPGPLPDDKAIGLMKRVGGALYYGITGKCPAKSTAAPAYLMTQQISYVATPMQVAQAPVPAPQPLPAPQVVYVQAPAPTVQASPQAAPQAFWTQPDEPKKKCWLFGGK